VKVGQVDAAAGEAARADAAFRQAADQCTTKANALSVAASANAVGQPGAAAYATTRAATLP
jgi:hypothetical protein